MITDRVASYAMPAIPQDKRHLVPIFDAWLILTIAERCAAMEEIQRELETGYF